MHPASEIRPSHSSSSVDNGKPKQRGKRGQLVPLLFFSVPPKYLLLTGNGKRNARWHEKNIARSIAFNARKAEKGEKEKKHQEQQDQKQEHEHEKKPGGYEVNLESWNGRCNAPTEPADGD